MRNIQRIFGVAKTYQKHFIRLSSSSEKSNQNVIKEPTTVIDYSPKIIEIVDNISKLTMIEVSHLNLLLKERLNIPDSPMPMMMGGQMPMMQQASLQQESEEDEEPEVVKSLFSLKIQKFEDTKKISLIKALKAISENMNLVQAKKYVESLPQTFKENLSKDEAEELKKKLEEAGAVCELE
ncbi:hypothetical protein SNEBB_005834 [Seison nebaliae]|nr:hypothetical protein SNEBB_005834 [Seison nebaliae]